MPRKKTVAVAGAVPDLAAYIEAFCAAPATRKAALDLSTLLAQVVGGQLQAALRAYVVEVGQRCFGGSIRRHHLDAWVSNQNYGLQLGVDVKGLNSFASVRKNWNNRVGDLHELATNHHQTSPKAVMGGVLAIPFERRATDLIRRIEKAMFNLHGRRAVTNAVNLLECSSLLVIDKEAKLICDDIPAADSPIRFERFAVTMASVFLARWE